VLLERGAGHVLAVDVGHGQLAAEVAADPRVTVHEGTNVRDLLPGDLGRPADLVVADLSFISLRLVVGPLIALVAPGGHLLVMVKPQFEVGRERLGARGVVASNALRREAVLQVAEVATAAGANVRAVVPSALPGSSGNREYFLWLQAPGAAGVADPARPVSHAGLARVEAAVAEAVGHDRPVLVGPEHLS
jgi:23S rRNA (cytidine1920-2'-O)/16S rRNA (cytidine1409-2'-O)-methyltransferase